MINEPIAVQEEFDPFASASDPAVQTYDLFGKVEISAWACALVKGTGKVPFDAQNPAHKRFTAIDVFIQPLPEIDVKYPKTCEEHWVAEFPEWAKITLPSIKAAGFDNVREINNKYARITRVPSGKKYEKKDRTTGQPTGEFADETTFKFVEFYGSEDECRKAYFAAGGQPMTNAPQQVATDPNDQAKQTALQFLKVIVTNAAKGKNTFDDAKLAVGLAITQYPTVAEHFNAESAEVTDLINQAIKA